MSDSDELSAAVTLHLDDQGYEYATDHPDTTRRMGVDITAVVLAVGYRKPRRITSVEEINSLRRMATVLDRHGSVWVNDGDHAQPWASFAEDPQGGPIWADGAEVHLPATVLYEPEPTE